MRKDEAQTNGGLIMGPESRVLVRITLRLLNWWELCPLKLLKRENESELASGYCISLYKPVPSDFARTAPWVTGSIACKTFQSTETSRNPRGRCLALLRSISSIHFPKGLDREGTLARRHQPRRATI